MLLPQCPAENRNAKGFNKLFCNSCQRSTYHYKPSDNNPAHCTEHSVWPAFGMKKETMEKVICEICNISFDKKFARPFFKYNTLCIACFTRESVAPVADSEKSITEEELENRQTNDRMSGLSVKQEFFIAEKTSLSELESLTIPEQYQAIQARIDGWSMQILEANTKREADFSKLMELRSVLTIEERAKLKIAHNEYNPGSLNAANVKPVVSKARMSKDDKAMLNMATIIFGKKMAVCNTLQKTMFTEHPEYYVNGEVRNEFKAVVDAYILNNGGMTDEQALAAVKESVQGAKKATIAAIADGTQK